MRRVAFITIHVGENFGSVLQTIATSEIIKRTGNDPVCVNYFPPRVTNKRFWSLGKANPLKLLFRILWKFYSLPLRIINKQKYYGYLKAHCTLSSPIYSEDKFTDKCPKADLYLTGSDQVWNIKHNEGIDTHYFFDGIYGKKASFASSIGYTDISDIEKKVFKKFLSEYSLLSVREDTAVDLLESIGIKVEQLVDPVFLLKKSEWEEFASHKKIVKAPYLLIYTPYNIVDKAIVYQYANYISRLANLKIITFSWTYYRDHNADKTVRFASPGDFLNLMLNADYIITNSFHGTAFSIVFNKRFWVLLPSGFTTRITSVLSTFDLSERLIPEEVPTNWDYGKDIIYDNVNIKLINERNKSMAFLMDAIR